MIIASRWNHTPAGIAALNTVAGYNSALATATTSGSIEPARKLSAIDCAQCQADMNRISGYIGRHQRVTAMDGTPNTWLGSSLFISSMDRAGRATVVFTGTESAIKLTDASGMVLATNPATYVSDVDVVDTRAMAAIVSRITPSQ